MANKYDGDWSNLIDPVFFKVHKALVEEEVGTVPKWGASLYNLLLLMEGWHVVGLRCTECGCSSFWRR